MDGKAVGPKLGGDCPECTRLADEHERLERSYADALDSMASSRGALRSEYTKLKIATNEAWLYAECARQELERHKRVHIHGAQLKMVHS
jgi:hypothetical protein